MWRLPCSTMTATLKIPTASSIILTLLREVPIWRDLSGLSQRRLTTMQERINC